MKLEDMILISVDDHITEPASMFDRHTPAKYKDRFPKCVRRDDGTDVWVFEGKVIPNVGLNAVVGRRPEEYGMEPTSFDQMRKGTHDVDGRIDDMNVNGILGNLNFGSFVGMAGHMFLGVKDKDLALAALKAYNDWHIDEWCGAYPGRFIPQGIVPLWDPKKAADEVRRIKEKGCNCITFPPNPARFEQPSLQRPDWDVLWATCEELEVVVNMHLGDSANAVPSPDSPVDAFITNMPVSLFACASDLVWSPILRKFKNIKFALSEGGTGWIPHFLERADYVYKHHKAWTHQDFGDKMPSDLFKEHVLTCFIDDKMGIKLRDEIGVESITWECDYPHSDTTWPNSPEVLWESLKDIPDREINLITHENAMRWYQFDPFKYQPKKECTVGALRSKAKHVSLEYLDTKGAGIPPTANMTGPIPMSDVIKQLSAGTQVDHEKATA